MRTKPNIQLAQNIAQQHGGKCLSKTVDKTTTKLIWECSVGHKWAAQYRSIKSGRWCPQCSYMSKKSREFNWLVKNHGGEVLSKYTNNRIPVTCKCENGHVWSPNLINLQKGKWCPYCSGNAKLTIESMKRIAQERGGECLSVKYVNNHSKLEWKCSVGHIWKSRPMDVIKGKWCPECKSFLGERACREILRQLTSYTFIKSRPKWLNGLELDGYCKELSLAFEYDGEYHHKVVFSFHDENSLKETQNRDRQKTNSCSNHGVSLIRIIEKKPFSLEKIKEQIINQLDSYNIPYRNVEINTIPIYTNDKLKKYSKIAEYKNGKCLSKTYISSSTKLEWMCKQGHKWMATPNQIWNGRWCPYCKIGRAHV
jgi:hypothetical protein